MLVGSYVLNFFGLSLAVVKIAGGLLVSSSGWHLFRAEQSTDADLVTASPAPALRFENLGFYPLTFPLTVGPGSLSAAVTLGAGVRVRDISQVSPVIGAIVGIALVSLVIYLCYRYATRVLGVLGATGTVVLLRLSAFILLAVGVQILTDGLVERFAILQP